MGWIVSDLVSPSLTTVEQQSLRMGAEAVRLLVRRMRDREVPAQHVVLPVNLRVRASTATATAVVAGGFTPTPAKGGG